MERNVLAIRKDAGLRETGRVRKQLAPERSLRVVQVASGDLWAGAEVQVYNLVCALQREDGVEAFVILFNEGLLARRLRERGVQVAVLDERRMHPGKMLRRSVRLLREWKADIVHTHRTKENVIGALAARLAGAASLRTVHGRDEHPPTRWQLGRRAVRAVDGAFGRYLQDAVVAVSDDLHSHLCARFPERKVRVVENGMDFERLRREATRRVQLPGRAEAIKIALAGRLVPVKRIDTFIAAAQALVARLPGAFEFYILGDGPLREQTRADIAQRGLENRVFMLGFKDPVAPYLKRMDMLFITSDHEGLPMNLLEALGLQVPVVAHAVGGIPHVLDRGRGGSLIYNSDPLAYAAAAEQYLRSPTGFRERARAGWASVRTRYSAATNKAAYLDLYRSLASARRAPGRTP